MSSSDFDFFNKEFFNDFATTGVAVLPPYVFVEQIMLSQDVSIIVSQWDVDKFSAPVICVS